MLRAHRQLGLEGGTVQIKLQAQWQPLVSQAGGVTAMYTIPFSEHHSSKLTQTSPGRPSLLCLCSSDGLLNCLAVH